MHFFLYEEKYRAEKLVCLLSVDGRLQIKRGEEIVGRADEKKRDCHLGKADGRDLTQMR